MIEEDVAEPGEAEPLTIGLICCAGCKTALGVWPQEMNRYLAGQIGELKARLDVIDSRIHAMMMEDR